MAKGILSRPNDELYSSDRRDKMIRTSAYDGAESTLLRGGWG